MNKSIAQKCLNKKNPFEYIVPPPQEGSEQLLTIQLDKCSNVTQLTCGSSRIKNEIDILEYRQAKAAATLWHLCMIWVPIIRYFFVIFSEFGAIAFSSDRLSHCHRQMRTTVARQMAHQRRMSSAPLMRRQAKLVGLRSSNVIKQGLNKIPKKFFFKSR